MADTFDETELLSRVDNDMGFLSETVEMLVCDGRATMQQVRDALAANDAKSVGTQAHALKGIISNFCSPQTQEVALQVEQMGKKGDLSEATAAVAVLGQRLEALITELEKFIKERT